MQKAALNQFMEKVMRVNPHYAGMGGASAGILGASSTNDTLVNELRSSVLAFGAEAVKPQPNLEKLSSLADQLEGVLRSMHVIGGISEAELDKLVAELHALTQAGANYLTRH